MSTKDNKESRKKPVKGYYIPSRHKQVAEGISKLSANSKDSTRDGRSSEASVLSSTAVKDRVALPPIDASAITFENSYCIKNKKDQGSSAESSTLAVPKQKESSTKVAGTKPAVKQKGKSTESSKNLEKEIDFLYIEYLQAKLCESKAKKALKMRSKKALEKIHELGCLMDTLLEKNFTVKRDLDFVNYLINLNERLKRQARFLLPNQDMVDLLEKRYEEISKNVYSKQHELGVINIKLPDLGSEGEIIEQVEQIKSLLHTIMSYIQNCEEVILNAEDADMLCKQGKFATEDLERGYQLVEEVTDLLLTETSMKLAC